MSSHSPAPAKPLLSGIMQAVKRAGWHGKVNKDYEAS